MRNGADYAVYINTAQEFDGCDSGAAPDEAMSWGKIKATASSAKVSCDATIAFPLLVSTVFKEEQIYRQKETTDFPRSPGGPRSNQWCNSPDGFILSSPWHEVP
eukprot:Gregarina_sp_Poly_1__2482@NODE_1672_length_3558_cov_1154_769121_g1098_i0_p4_GENE_NODE_1672_length_3558_cov_1154_769121_g1098_i0NODE_1672_length_3558_cov_1154_769121_g1098_i0_p4_ORF_typecomplete_len104_score13_08DS/PF01916_17/4_3e26_NODE_1672_length_3558_cov_1154_769121_g1098_i014241735